MIGTALNKRVILVKKQFLFINLLGFILLSEGFRGRTPLINNQELIKEKDRYKYQSCFSIC